MRLVFPNGEHGQVLLAPGVNRVGSGPDNGIVLDAADVLERHCELNLTAQGLSLVPASRAQVQVNGRPVAELIALRSGDVISIAGVQARVVALQAAGGEAGPGADGDVDATRIRPAMPKLLLRGVTAPLFGKVFPLQAPMEVGRAPECDLPVPVEQISRRHARLTPMDDHVRVEDLGSANGTFIDGRKVETGVLRPGQELRLDTVRFLLVAPGQPAPAPRRTGPATLLSHRWLAIGVVVVALLVIGALVFNATG